MATDPEVLQSLLQVGMTFEQNRTLLPQAKVLMAGCQNSQHGHLRWLPIMT